jgi:hypothetical protein
MDPPDPGTDPKKNGGRPNDEAKRFSLDILHGIEYIHR